MSVSDTLVVSINGAAPNAGLPATQGLCSGEVFTLSTPVGGAIYLWNTGATTPSINVSMPGTYILTVTNSCGMDIDTTIVTDLGDVPIVNIGPDLSICDGDTVLLSPSSTGTYQWNDGSMGNTFEVTKPGTVILTVSNVCGATADTLDVTLLGAIPLLNLGMDTSICPGELVVFAPGIPNVNYTWSDGSTGQTFTSGTAGSIFLNISNTCGSISDTVNISVLPAAPVLNLGIDFSICPGETVVLDPGLTGVMYLWNDGSTGNTYTVTDQGLVILTVSNSCGMSSDTITVTEDLGGPSLNLGPNISVCEGASVVVAPGINGVQYLWQDGSTTPVFTATISTQVILQISNACGVATDTMNVTISGTPPVVDLGPDLLLCDQETATLSVSGAGNMVEWQDGSTLPVYQVSTAGIYSVMLTNACGTVMDTVIIDTGNSPQPFDLGADEIICPGDEVVLIAPSVTPGSTLMWNDGSSGSTLVANSTGNYMLTIANNCGTASDQLTIDVDLNAITDPVPDRFKICDGERVTLNAQQTFAATYLWSTGAQTASVDVADIGTYMITVTSDCDQLTAEIFVEEGDCVNPTVFIPNVFSPNNDNVNDVFSIDLDVSDITDFRIFVYDRWGEVVFGSTDPGFEWEGDYLHKLLLPGVYVYYIKLTREGSRPEIFKGDITLIR
jgi:gliding motility-associated-like protein